MGTKPNHPATIGNQSLIPRHPSLASPILRRQIIRPRLHQLPTLLDQIPAPVRGLDLIGDRVRQRHFDGLGRKVRALRCPVTET